MSQLQYIGGHIYVIEDDTPDGHGRHAVSVEIEAGKTPFVFGMERPLTKEEVENLVQKVAEVMMAPYGGLR